MIALIEYFAVPLAICFAIGLVTARFTFKRRAAPDYEDRS